MFPIRDHNPSLRTPYVTYGLLAANILGFMAYWLTLTDEQTLGQFIYTFGLVPNDVIYGDARLSIITHMFMHGGWMHLFGNMLFLWIFGDNLEEVMGHKRFALFYVGAGLCAAALQIAGDPTSSVPMVGASGAIGGVLGGYLLLYPKARVDVLIIFVIFFRIFPVPAWIVLGVWFAMQIISTVMGAADGVAYLAHIGGFLGGLALAYPVWAARGGRAFWVQTSGTPPFPAMQYAHSSTGIPRIPRK
jgi:membrane associated rhomboid family serine protease